MIEKKRKCIFQTACAAAAAASTTAAVPIPGFSVGCKIGIMQAFLYRAFIFFGVDEKSLQRLSERVNKPVGELSSTMKSRFAGGVDEKVVAGMLSTTAMVAAKTIEVLLTSIPAIGSFGSVGIAFATTLHLLDKGIKEMVEDAKAVLMAAGPAFTGQTDTMRLLALILLVGSAAAVPREDGKIIGGQECEPHSRPWMASLNYGYHFCGAVLINEQWVLSVAHCWYNPYAMQIMLGDHNLRVFEGTEQLMKTQNIIWHPRQATPHTYPLPII
ncbi:unnamed protein product [Coregonus sp. 'balchen']|nr:unnamed protein product [Coregonus sp. 'balchen']